MKTPIAMPVAKLCRAYGRVSNEEQLSKTFDSVEKQIEYMEHFVGTNQSQGWVWDKQHEGYKDKGVTGSNFDRPAFKAMMADAEAGRFKILVVLDVGRFGRNASQGTAALDKLYGWGLEVRVRKMPHLDFTDPEGRRAWQQELVAKEYERGTNRESCILGLIAKASKGYVSGGRPPYAYRVRNGVLEVTLPAAEKLVVKIWRLYAEYGTSSRVYSELMKQGIRYAPLGNDDEIKSGKQRVISRSWIDATVRNFNYAGFVSSPGLAQKFAEQFKPAYVNPAGKMYFKGRHKAIIGTKLWIRVRDVLDSKPKDGRGKHERFAEEYLLQGLLTCACCKSSMNCAAGQGSKRKVYRYYVCHSVHVGQRYATCALRHISADAAETVLIRYLGQLAQHPDLVAATVDAANAAGGKMERELRESQSRLNKELAAIKAKMKHAVSFIFQQGGSNLRDAVTAQYDALTERMREIEKTLGSISKDLEVAANASPSEGMVKTALEHFSRLVSHLSRNELKELIRLLVAKIVVRKIDQSINRRFAEIPLSSWIYRMDVGLSKAGVVLGARSLSPALPSYSSYGHGKSLAPVSVTFEVRRCQRGNIFRILEPINYEQNVVEMEPAAEVPIEWLEKHPLWLAEKMAMMVASGESTKTTIARMHKRSSAWVTYHFRILQIAQEIRSKLKSCRSKTVLIWFGLNRLKRLAILPVEQQHTEFEREFGAAMVASENSNGKMTA